MKSILFFLFAFLSLIATFSLWPEEEKGDYPSMLQVCGDAFTPEEVSTQPWWPALIREVNHRYPGYCLTQVVVDGSTIYYEVRSPDGTETIEASVVIVIKET